MLHNITEPISLQNFQKEFLIIPPVIGDIGKNVIRKLELPIKIKGVSNYINLIVFFEECDGFMVVLDVSFNPLSNTVPFGETKKNAIHSYFLEKIVKNPSLRCNFETEEAFFLCHEPSFLSHKFCNETDFSNLESRLLKIRKMSSNKELIHIAKNTLWKTDIFYNSRFEQLLFQCDDHVADVNMEKPFDFFCSVNPTIFNLSEFDLLIDGKGRIFSYLSNISVDDIRLFTLHYSRNDHDNLSIYHSSSKLISLAHQPFSEENKRFFFSFHDAFDSISDKLKSKYLKNMDTFPVSFLDFDILHPLALGKKEEQLHQDGFFKISFNGEECNIHIDGFNNGCYSVIAEGMLFPLNEIIRNDDISRLSNNFVQLLKEPLLGITTITPSYSKKTFDGRVNNKKFSNFLFEIVAESDKFFYCKIPKFYVFKDSEFYLSEFCHDFSNHPLQNSFSEQLSDFLYSLDSTEETNKSIEEFRRFTLNRHPKILDEDTYCLPKSLFFTFGECNKSVDFIFSTKSSDFEDVVELSAAFLFLKSQKHLFGRNVSDYSLQSLALLIYMRCKGRNFATYFNELLKYTIDYKLIQHQISFENHLLGYLSKVPKIFESKK